MRVAVDQKKMATSLGTQFICTLTQISQPGVQEQLSAFMHVDMV